MYQIGRVVSFQVDPEIVLRKRRVVKYRLLKKGSANDRPNYTLELRIIHVQKLQVDKREAICLAERMALKSILLTTSMHLQICLQDFKK